MPRGRSGAGSRSSFGSRNRSSFGNRSGFRSSGRSRGPSAFSLELMAKPSSDMHGYYFPISNGTFDSSEYQPQFSDNRVSQSDIENLKNEMQKNPYIGIVCCWEFLFIPLIMGCMGASIGLTASSIASSFATAEKNEDSISFGEAMPAMMGMAFGGMLCIVCVCCFASKRIAKRIAAYAAFLNHVLTTQQQTVFGPKECTLTLSPHHSYLKIEFNWRPRPAMMMVPAGMMLVPQPGTQNMGFGGAAGFPGQQGAFQGYVPPSNYPAPGGTFGYAAPPQPLLGSPAPPPPFEYLEGNKYDMPPPSFN